MNQIEYEILVYCLQQGENTWVSEYAFARNSIRRHKTIERALQSLLERNSIQRKWGWYWSGEHGKIFRYYYRIVAKKEGATEKE